jgi:alkanesulfonate monooxygenase SsuD/methylene tetrahydromethanopterin reductase-like flavin-dependent oxidoreductase (luciferase family)
MALGDEIIIGSSINNTMGITGRSYDIPQLLHAAREAEAMGFDAVWVHDALGGRRTTAAYCPIGALTAAAAQTSRIKLCTGILIPQIRNPIHVAQQWATLWEVSEGRAIMGVGTGAGKNTIYKRQFDALAAVRGADKDALNPEQFFKRRTALFAECLDVMNRLWTEDKFPYDGEFFKFGPMTLGIARPAKKPPILVGGGIYVPRGGVGAHHYAWSPELAGKLMMGPKIRRVIAEQGDGWIAVHPTTDEYGEIWEDIQNIAIDAGKTPDSAYGGPSVMGMNWFANCDDDSRVAWEGVQNQLTDFHGPPEGSDKAAPDLVDRWALSGTGREMADKINRYIDKGVTVFQLVIASPDQLGMMRKIAEEVLPHVKRKAAVKVA